MQVLAHNPEIQTYSNEDGNFITGFLIGTKLNDANWRINKQTGHDLIRKFEGTDFAIIPQLITKPLSQGGGGHYFGQDTREDLLKGYAEHSHGKYHKVLGPYSYNDGTDDYFYNAIIKLRDSKAASELVKHGKETWVPYSVSPHIWPRAGPDSDIFDWEPIGGALVIKGAYGSQAVLSKMCKGTSAQCEKSLGASTDRKDIGLVLNEIAKPCEVKDAEAAEIISSLVSKTASIQTSMPENKADTTSNTPVVTTLTAEVAKPNATVESQTAITNAAITKVVTPEQYSDLEKRFAEVEKQNKQLQEDKKMNTLNNLLSKVKDEKAKEELIKKYSKSENVDLVKEIINEWYPVLRASEEEDKEDKPAEDEDVQQAKKVKSKGASSSLPAEPVIPKDEESKAASIPVNKLQTIVQFRRSGGRA